MTTEITGQLSNDKKRKYACNIFTKSNKYFSFLVSNRHEFEVYQYEKLVFQSHYICESIIQKIFSYGYLKFVDLSENELFRIRKTGLFKQHTQLKLNESEYRLPLKNSFSIPAIGYKIEIKGTNFIATIEKEENHFVAILLSYFCWLRQQIWNNMV